MFVIQVRISVRFRGRENMFKEVGRETLEKFTSRLEGNFNVEKPSDEENGVCIIIQPKR